MELSDLMKRVYDLEARCERSSCVTMTVFLTPAEQHEINTRGSFSGGDSTLLMHGGAKDCERKICFFLPYYVEPDSFDIGEHIKAVKIQSFFGIPEHRDYLGAVLGLGIERDRIGDIIVRGDTAWVFCLQTVLPVLMNELEKVGSFGVKVSEIPLREVPAPEKKVNLLSFTVKSLRLDAVTGDLFGISRTQAAELIRLGAVSLNYNVCDKPDAPVTEGAVISIRGKGKGKVTEVGGRSRKDRLFIKAERYL